VEGEEVRGGQDRGWGTGNTDKKDLTKKGTRRAEKKKLKQQKGTSCIKCGSRETDGQVTGGKSSARGRKSNRAGSEKTGRLRKRKAKNFKRKRLSARTKGKR